MAHGYSGVRAGAPFRLGAAHMPGRVHDPHRAAARHCGPPGPFVRGETPSHFLFRHGVTLSEERRVICLDMMVGNGTLIGNT